MDSAYKLLVALFSNPPPAPILYNTVLSQQRNLPTTSLGHKMLSLKLGLSLLLLSPFSISPASHGKSARLIEYRLGVNVSFRNHSKL